MIEPGRNYGVKGSSADVADGLESFLLFFCASKVMLALSSQAYGWPVPDLSRRELIPNEDTASDRFLSVQDWAADKKENQRQGQSAMPSQGLHRALKRLLSNLVPTQSWEIRPCFSPRSLWVKLVRQEPLAQAECVLSSFEAWPIGREALTSLSARRQHG